MKWICIVLLCVVGCSKPPAQSVDDVIRIPEGYKLLQVVYPEGYGPRFPLLLLHKGEEKEFYLYSPYRKNIVLSIVETEAEKTGK